MRPLAIILLFLGATGGAQSSGPPKPTFGTAPVAAADRNADGFLNRYEFDFVFSPAGVVKLLQGKAYVPFQDGDPGPDFDAADKDQDGRVSFAEFKAYYTAPLLGVLSSDEPAEE